MDAKELRIGNLVLTCKPEFEDKKDFVQTKISSAMIDYIEMKQLLVKPIILTEKLFVKLGFVYNLEGLSITNGRKTLMIPKFNDSDHILVLYQHDIFCGFNTLMYIKYVHDIQNLCSILISKKLTL